MRVAQGVDCWSTFAAIPLRQARDPEKSDVRPIIEVESAAAKNWPWMPTALLLPSTQPLVGVRDRLPAAPGLGKALPIPPDAPVLPRGILLAPPKSLPIPPVPRGGAPPLPPFAGNPAAPVAGLAALAAPPLAPPLPATGFVVWPPLPVTAFTPFPVPPVSIDPRPPFAEEWVPTTLSL